jgi:hypothetical protein
LALPIRRKQKTRGGWQSFPRSRRLLGTLKIPSVAHADVAVPGASKHALLLCLVFVWVEMLMMFVPEFDENLI